MLHAIARQCNVNFYVPKHPQGNGLALCIGSGLMLATMDEIKTLSTVVEYNKELRMNPRFYDWIALSSYYADFIFVHAWFSITKPDDLMLALQHVERNKLYVKSNIDLRIGHRVTTLKDASALLNNTEEKQ